MGLSGQLKFATTPTCNVSMVASSIVTKPCRNGRQTANGLIEGKYIVGNVVVETEGDTETCYTPLTC